jgi:hypothetical protein
MLDVHVGGRRARHQHLAPDVWHRPAVRADAVHDAPVHHAKAGDGQPGRCAKHVAVQPTHERAAAPSPPHVLRLCEAGEHDVVTGTGPVNQRWDGLGRMLQVVVQAGHQIALRRAEPPEQCRVLATVGGAIDDAQALVPNGGRTQHVRARVGAAVIDGDHFIRPLLPVTDADDAIDRLADDGCAVVDGNDDRNHRTRATVRSRAPLAPATPMLVRYARPRPSGSVSICDRMRMGEKLGNMVSPPAALRPMQLLTAVTRRAAWTAPGEWSCESGVPAARRPPSAACTGWP